MMREIADECIRVGARKLETLGDFVRRVSTSLAWA
jgi:hypothetical protein